MKKEGISVAESARKLGISLDAAYKLLAAGKLAGRKVDGVWIVSTLSVQERLNRSKRNV